MQNLFFFGHKKALAEKCKVRKELMPRNSGHCGGRGWIRTIEAEKQQIYSLPPLATRELVHIGSAFDPVQIPGFVIGEDGAGGRTRTPDLLITNQLLYQLSYTSANIFIVSHLFAFVKYFFEIFQNFFDSSELEITLILVEATGLEPAASWSQTKHSTKLSYASNSTSGLVRVRQLLYYSKAKAFCQV